MLVKQKCPFRLEPPCRNMAQMLALVLAVTSGALIGPPETSQVLDVTLEHVRGKARVVDAVVVALARPAAQPRRTGRFAARVFLGKRLWDEIQFDFPLLAETHSAGADAKTLDRALFSGVTARTTVRLPWIPGVSRILIVDRRSCGPRGCAQFDLDMRRVRANAATSVPEAKPSR